MLSYSVLMRQHADEDIEEIGGKQCQLKCRCARFEKDHGYKREENELRYAVKDESRDYDWCGGTPGS